MIILLILNAVTFLVTGYDKWAAKRFPRHRVPEKILLLFCVFGGGIGTVAACLLFHHKTRKKHLFIPFCLITLIEIGVAAALHFIK